MDISDLGFDEWFRKKRDELGRPDCGVARVVRVDRERYLIRNEKGEVQGEPTGRLLFGADSGENLPCVGDWVFVQYFNEGTLGIVHDVLPRKTLLRRKAAGRKVDYQAIASNIDVAFIVQSCDRDFNIRRMERYIVAAKDGSIEPAILLSKSDLVSAEELKNIIRLIREAHFEENVIAFSNTSGDGLQSVRESLLRGKTYSLLGSSGVGKTTLLNHLLGGEDLKTGPIREKDGRGRHITVRRELHVLDNGAMIIDTPGMRELGMMGVDPAIEDVFPEIHSLSGECRFRDCTHTSEDGCAVLAGLETGEVDEKRYMGYLKLLKESEFNNMSYVERRKKDKSFGKMVKSVLKEKLKRRGKN